MSCAFTYERQTDGKRAGDVCGAPCDPALLYCRLHFYKGRRKRNESSTTTVVDQVEPNTASAGRLLSGRSATSDETTVVSQILTDVLYQLGALKERVRMLEATPLRGLDERICNFEERITALETHVHALEQNRACACTQTGATEQPPLPLQLPSIEEGLAGNTDRFEYLFDYYGANKP